MKTIIINDNRQLKDIKAEFSEKFPHLKIEFFKDKHSEGEGSTLNSMYDDELFIRDVRTIHNEGELSINGHTKTSTFETNFKEKFGINVQVWRRSKNMWLQTTTTDEWTLSEQEKVGIEYDN